MKPLWLWVFSFGMATSVAHSQDKLLSLTNLKNQTIQVSVEPGRSDGVVNLRNGAGKFFPDIPLSSFTSESQEAIAKQLVEYRKSLDNADVTKDSRLNIGFQRKKKDRNNDYGDIDDRVINMQPRITIENEERFKTFRRIEGDVYITGREVLRKDTYVVLAKQKFQFPALMPDARESWDGKAFEFRYDPDYGGFDYDGYLIVVKKKDGDVAIVKGSSSRLEKLAEPIMAAKIKSGYDKTFLKSKSLHTTFGLPK